MTNSNPNNSGNVAPPAPTQSQDFFIPDLCQVQAVLFLVLVAELLAIVLELAGNGLRAFSWESLSLTSLLVQWSFLLSAALLCQLRERLSHWPLPWAAAGCYLLILAVVASTSAAGQWLLAGIGGGTSRSVDVWALATHVLICAVLAGIVLRYFYLTQQLRLQQRTELQARIQALQSRIRPHFLFNSMNIIASLIPVNQDAAETAVEDLASLFRASLSEVVTEVSLAEELELCRRYIRIEQLRLGQRLKVDWQLAGVPQDLKIPSLCLQPLLENAIYHGIQQMPEGGAVIITAIYEKGELCIDVINPVLTGQSRHVDGNSLALENIHHRLQALYGPKAGLEVELVDGQHRAVIRYPVSEKDKL